jgi:hypothetical protein
MPKGLTGKSAMHSTNVYRAFAQGADAGLLPQAFIASVAQLSDEKTRDVRVLQGDGTNTVAKKGRMAVGMRGTHPRRASKASR